MDKFWFCWCVGCGVPRKKHETLEEAKKEASRLAQKENSEVIILESIICVKKAEMPVEFKDMLQAIPVC